jgi:hypothetical protein
MSFTGLSLVYQNLLTTALCPLSTGGLVSAVYIKLQLSCYMTFLLWSVISSTKTTTKDDTHVAFQHHSSFQVFIKLTASLGNAKTRHILSTNAVEIEWTIGKKRSGGRNCVASTHPKASWPNILGKMPGKSCKVHTNKLSIRHLWGGVRHGDEGHNKVEGRRWQERTKRAKPSCARTWRRCGRATCRWSW